MAAGAISGGHCFFGVDVLRIWVCAASQVQLRLLQLAQLDAAVDALDGVLESHARRRQPCAWRRRFSRRRGLTAEQKLPVEPTRMPPISVVNCAWTLSQLVWMYFHAWSRVSSSLKGDGELDGRVLIAHLAGDGVVERALDERRVFELGQQAQCALLELRIG